MELTDDLRWLRVPQCRWVRFTRLQFAVEPTRFLFRDCEIVAYSKIGRHEWAILYLNHSFEDEGFGACRPDPRRGEMALLERQRRRLSEGEQRQREIVREHWNTELIQSTTTPEPRRNWWRRLWGT